MKKLKISLVVFAIMFFLDSINIITIIYTKLSTKIDPKIIIGLILITLVYVFIDQIDKKFWRILFNKNRNFIDDILDISFLSVIWYIITSFLLVNLANSYYNYILYLIIILIVIRKFIMKINKRYYENSYNTIELCDLYNNKFGSPDQDIIILDEKDVNYDMLKRDTIINILYNTIKGVIPKKNFRIGLYGEWGSGKTTIINNVIKKLKLNSKNDYIIVRNFEPWMYDNKEALFTGIYNEIIRKLENEKYIGNYRELFYKYKKMIFNIIDKKYGVTLHSFDNKTISDIKDAINKILMQNGKKIIFIIDNIDRLNKENIELIFKTVTTILDMDNIIYLLSFDRNRIDKIFETEIKKDKEYLEKIINCEIEVPNIDNNILVDISVKSINNLLNYYDRMNGIDNETYTKYMYEMCKGFKNLRELKRFINTASIVFNNNELYYLNDLDMLLIEYLRFKDVNLYAQIKDNPKFFISEDLHLREDMIFLGEEYNKEAKAFFERIIPKDDYTKEILKYLFPNVTKYLNNQDIKNNGYIITGDWIKKQKIQTILNKRIFSARYFELYFIKCDNIYTNINMDVNKTISSVKANNMMIFETSFNNLIDKYYDNKKEVIELFTYNIIDEKIDIKKQFIKCVSETFFKYDKIPDFFNFNSSFVAVSSIYDILATLSEKEIVEIMKSIIDTSDNIEFIDSILYYIKPHDKREHNLHEEIYNELKLYFQNKLNSLIENSINLFEKNIYGNKIIWTLNRYIEDKEKLKEYISKVLNSKIIFKFLYNFVTESSGTNGFGYSINKKNIKEFIDLEEIDIILKEVDYIINEQQKIITDLYELSKHTEKDEDSFEKDIYRKAPIKFEQLFKV